jgi:hypothetical protein
MSIINTLLLSMRYELQDITGDTYSDYVLIDQYNKGNKLLRKTILDHLPMQLAEEVTGSVLAGESIAIAKKPIKFIDVRVNKRKIDKVSVSEILDKTTTGEPRAYYLLNTSTIKLYPIPDKTYSYEITYIPESATMAEIDDSGYQTDVEELLVRYVVASLTGKGFDLIAEYNSTIGSLLSGIETGVTVVNGYYSDCEGRGDYN